MTTPQIDQIFHEEAQQAKYPAYSTAKLLQETAVEWINLRWLILS